MYTVKPSSATPAATVATDLEKDRLLGRAYAAALDSFYALSFQGQFEKQQNAYRKGVDPWLYSSQRELNTAMEPLKVSSFADPVKEELRQSLLEHGKSLNEATDLMVQAIRTAQDAIGWSAQANDIESRSFATSKLAPFAPEVQKLVTTDQFKDTLPEYLKQFLIENDESGFQIGTTSPPSHPWLILSVRQNGFADRFGLKPLDVLKSLANRPTQSVPEFKEAMRNHRGQQAKLVVSRSGREVTLDVKIPLDLP